MLLWSFEDFFRDFGISTVYVTSPDIKEIRSSTGLLVSSGGPLGFPDLTLISESFSNPDAVTTDGAFDIEVANSRVRITVNGIAFLKLRGRTETLDVFVAAGDSRIEADDLIANTVQVNHRGSNDLLVYPESTIEGGIRGYGDVISLNRPDTVDVEELFEGRLIFRD